MKMAATMPIKGNYSLTYTDKQRPSDRAQRVSRVARTATLFRQNFAGAFTSVDELRRLGMFTVHADYKETLEDLPVEYEDFTCGEVIDDRVQQLPD